MHMECVFVTVYACHTSCQPVCACLQFMPTPLINLRRNKSVAQKNEALPLHKMTYGMSLRYKHIRSQIELQAYTKTHTNTHTHTHIQTHTHTHTHTHTNIHRW